MNVKINKIIKAQFSKFKFSFGFNPKIDKSDKEYNNFIPKPYKAVCLISADLELAWAYRWAKKNENSFNLAEKNGMKTRENVPKILNLCEIYDIPITWATVGHLFLSNCKRVNKIAHPEILRLPYFENLYWKYSLGDWFDSDPCTNYIEDPAWYAPDLVKMINENSIKHEIGCHTFSHIDCRDEICSKDVFESEILKCKELAKEFGIELKSFVHPGFTIGHLEDIEKLGFTSFRTNYANELTYPKKHFSKLWEFRNTMEFCWRKEWSINYHIKRYKTIIDRAIQYNKICVFWFHPSLETNFVDYVLPEILAYLNYKSQEIKCLTHSDYADWLNEINNY